LVWPQYKKSFEDQGIQMINRTIFKPDLIIFNKILKKKLMSPVFAGTLNNYT